MGSATLDAVTEALRNVEDPIFQKSLGTLGTLVEARIDEGRVWAKIRVSSPSEEVRNRVRHRVKAALEPLGVEFVELELEVDVPTREATSTDPIPEVRNAGARVMPTSSTRTTAPPAS